MRPTRSTLEAAPIQLHPATPRLDTMRGALPRKLFHRPTQTTISVARESGILGPRSVILSTLPARVAWAAYLRRRVPRRIVEARLRPAPSGGRTSHAVISGERTSFRGGVLVAVAPGERRGLDDLIESVRRYEGEDIKIVVADDLTGEYPDRLVQLDYPGIDFVRPAIPSGSSYCAFRTLQAGYLHFARTYEVGAILKVDPDSLLIGAGAFDRAIERFGSDASVGLLGTTEVDATGRPTDYRWAGWMAHPELRWSRRFRRLVDAARGGVWELEFAQAGAYFVSGAAVRAADERGFLAYRQPQWSLQVDDVIMDLVVQAAGFRVASFGAPGEPIASDNLCLPLEPAELLEAGFKVVHSVRSSPAGMSEEDIRAYFHAARAADQAVPVGVGFGA
jgi:hypothetical protein